MDSLVVLNLCLRLSLCLSVSFVSACSSRRIHPIMAADEYTSTTLLCLSTAEFPQHAVDGRRSLAHHNDANGSAATVRQLPQGRDIHRVHADVLPPLTDRHGGGRWRRILGFGHQVE